MDYDSLTKIINSRRNPIISYYKYSQVKIYESIFYGEPSVNINLDSQIELIYSNKSWCLYYKDVESVDLYNYTVEYLPCEKMLVAKSYTRIIEIGEIEDLLKIDLLLKKIIVEEEVWVIKK